MNESNTDGVGLQPRLIASPRLTRASRRSGTTSERLKRLDGDPELREALIPFCRLKFGEVWEDPIAGHRIGVLDSTDAQQVKRILNGSRARLIVADPPYNMAVGGARTTALSKINLDAYLEFSKAWITNHLDAADKDAHLYLWLGADFRDDFQPLPDVMILLRSFKALSPRNLITLRNQRGYGTQNNWMWVRQELLHYVKGNPDFSVVYTDIPKILRGYHKMINGKVTENLDRSKSPTIRPGNVWVDVQQVFYRMDENVPGCYAQKPLKAIERIIASSSKPGDLVVDGFAHSGTTLLAGERLGRRVFTFDIDPVFAEITIRRLERYRSAGKTGWQWRSPFPEVDDETTL